MALCGVLPEEVVRPQPFRVDVDLEVDLVAAGASDALADTVDYGGLTDALVACAAERHHGLMEHLADRLARVGLVGTGPGDERVTAVTITLTKLRPPVAHDLASSGVRITRRR